MVSRILAPKSNVVQYGIIIIVGAVLLLVLLMKHYEITWQQLSSSVSRLQTATLIIAARANIVALCESDETLTIFSPSVYVCDGDVDSEEYRAIYEHYPVRSNGRSSMYGFISRGERTRADEMLRDIYHVSRYEAVTLPAPLDWESDPFKERYWRFIFYSLRPVRHLLAVGAETGSPRYYEKAVEVIGSFLDEGMDSSFAWDDSHAVAFRTMILVHAWWTLREAGQLNAQLSSDLLDALKQHGTFLADPANYEAEYNHAVTQGAALLLLAKNFPDLDDAPRWEALAIARIDDSLSRIIDPDGVLIENSPYYHFYVLEKYWEIYAYAEQHDLVVSENFAHTIEDMITFGTYVLRPDVSIPLLGASIPRTLTHSRFYQTITETHPELAFVLTQGERGSRPAALDTWYPSSGIALWRSGWGEKRPYRDETYLMFDTGPYRTDHSDLDALTFSLYSYGTPVIRDSGLYTYETEHPFYNYFYGTRGHNTVMVDGQDQRQGTGEVRPVQRGGGYTTLAARHTLYDGVTHLRTITFLKPDTLVVADTLVGARPHYYEQLFHFSPDTVFGAVSARVHDGYVQTPAGGQAHFQLEQLIPTEEQRMWNGSLTPIRGWCAEAYEVRVPCPEVAFQNNATSTRYLTVISVGQTALDLRSDYNPNTGVLLVRTPEGDSRTVVIDWPIVSTSSGDFITLTVSDAGAHFDSGPLERIRAVVRGWFQ